MGKRRKKRPTPWDRADPFVLDGFCSYLGPDTALGLDPGSRGIGAVICDTQTARLLAAAAVPLPRSDYETCGMLHRLVNGCRLVAIERQPGLAKRAVVRVEGWAYATAFASAAKAVYIRPRRKTDPLLDMPGDETVIRRDIAPDGATFKQAEKLREHARSALWIVRRALADLRRK